MQVVAEEKLVHAASIGKPGGGVNSAAHCSSPSRQAFRVLKVDSDSGVGYPNPCMETNTNFNYRAWGADNIAYGPVELPGLVTWIKQGKVTANSWVFREKDSTWSRASDLTETKVLFKSKLPPSAAASGDTFGIQPGALRRIKMLADVDERLLGSLLSYLEVVRVPPFGVVVNKGDHGDALFMVLEGEVRARVMIDGKETTLTTMGVGECFGELAIVDHGPRSADVIANQPAILIKVSEAALKKMFTEAPALAAPFMFALTRVIAQRVRVLTKRYEDSIHFSRTASAASAAEL